IPFLFGALFVSLTDTPGPIHHRRNGMLVAITLNTLVVWTTSLLYPYPFLVIAEVAVLGFLFSMLGIYGSRAGAVGTLALVIMLINMSPIRHEHSGFMSALLTAGGGAWYAGLSLVLYRLQPYRLVEQALGENLILIAGYIRARASFYKEDADVEAVFTRVMKEQVEVLKTQSQIRELLFKTRQLVGDASPKSRSMMMIFLESLDLFEETMYSYQDYKLLHANIESRLLNNFYRVIIQVVAEFEHIGLAVQAGTVIKKMPSFTAMLDELETDVEEQLKSSTPTELQVQSLKALRKTVRNLRSITGRLNRIVLYTRLEAFDPDRFPDQDIEKPTETTPITVSLLKENLTIRSNTFRFAIRITAALLVGYGVSALFALSHAYWVMLTVLTILKPVYHLARKRNIQRVAGTLIGVVVAGGILFLITSNTVLVIIMILCMLMAYSLLRINYFGFVTFLTLYVVITFHFLNPVEFKKLIGERLIDTLIGSVIAAIAARFIFPVWQHNQIQSAMKKTLMTNTTYFLAAWNALRDPNRTRQYNAARNEAIVALTNLTDNFQQMLVEPVSSRQSSQVHQFVIASHSLISRISSLTAKDLADGETAKLWVDTIVDTLQQAVANLDMGENEKVTSLAINTDHLPVLPELHPLSIVLGLARDIHTIAANRAA
ncbi:MAG TPA: FUSC family membrane protein, partial [Ohtaekwangia sp.]